MEISLVRHGKSTHNYNHRITSETFRDWVKMYDDSGVIEESTYPSNTVQKIEEANIILTSHLTRSVDSAKLLNPKATFTSDDLFREAELPILTNRLRLRLTPNTWAFLLRCLWFCGYSRDCESLSKAQARANEAAKLLIEYAKKHTAIVLVGHGIFNRLIAKELQKAGWQGKGKVAQEHWKCTTYTFFE